MPAAGAGVRNAGPVWGLGMGMPPLGFGVVPQQPGNMMMGGQVQQMAPQVANWQQQQFMAAQVGSRNWFIDFTFFPPKKRKGKILFIPQRMYM